MKRLLGIRNVLQYGAGSVVCSVLMTAVVVGQQDELAEVRRATAWFHKVESAQAAHYHPMAGLNHCIANPGVGAMGYHYFNAELIADVSPPDPLRPEAMVYAPGPDGKLQLAAVEWVVPAQAWHAAGNTEPPSVLGKHMHILNPVLGWYILHAWIWRPNPAGMFEDWNPNVTCP
jgi:hypothetical protein